MSLVDVYGFLLDEPWHCRLEDVLRLTDFQVATLYNPPRDKKTGARKASPKVKGTWTVEDREEVKARFFQMGAALRFSPEKLAEAWRASCRKRGVTE